MRYLLALLVLVAACSSDSPTDPTRAFEVSAIPVHVGDIDVTDKQTFACKSGKSSCEFHLQWAFYVHDTAHAPVPGVEVRYYFSNWKYPTPQLITGCVTNVDGRCSMGITSDLPKGKNPSGSVTIQVVSVGGDYTPSLNHDPDGDSDGTTMVVQVIP